MTTPTNKETPGYQVLARKYRPASFDDLLGQDAMVQTLKNAFEADRIAHAFVLTGVRGVGKTTTARIIAKGMNCIGADGKGGPTVSPCGTCEPCQAIAEGRHVDVLEMDAASRTGVGDIREIIDAVRYRAASARYKIYIIDEVHMLSTNAFNALLKTLEEPPEHVKFIFATTEIRKIPVTVLSRCQRYDLRRIEPEVMMAHLARLAELEKAEIAQDALALITRAAEGSVRDALSLMDQAIAHGAGTVNADQVRTMLGLADRGRILDLFELIMRGDAATALNEISEQYAQGADPLSILRDLAEVTHWVSVAKITPQALEDPTVSPDERERGKKAAADLPMRALSRMWQMLLKALEELAQAPNPMMAAEMAIIRLTHVAELPSPEDLIRKLQNTSPPTGTRNGPETSKPNPDPTPRSSMRRDAPTAPSNPVTPRALGGSLAVSQAPNATVALARFMDFDSVINLIRSQRDIKLLVDVENNLRLVSYAPGRIEFQPTKAAPKDLASRLGARLQTWTGVRWGVSVVSEGGSATLVEERNAAREDLHGQLMQHDLIKAVFASFPDAEIREVRQLAPPEDRLTDGEQFTDDPDWNPFEEN